MAKAKKKDNEDRAAQRLARARSKLNELESALKKAERKGEERVRVARERADKRVARARERVQEQAAVVARREAAVAERSPKTLVQPEVIHSPEVAADLIEQAAIEAGPAAPDEQTILLDGSGYTSDREPETEPELP
jgi:ElaB/YqjD/DUF883 family membrane-anchored ribosome-binding protein